MFVFSDMDDQILTNDIVSDLITCSKAIISAPSPKNKANFQHKETNINLSSTDSKFRFTVFIRENINW